MSEPSELDLLKQRATVMGIEFGPNIGVETLRERINARLNGPAEQGSQSTQVDPKEEDPFRVLVRCRIVNLNPAKAGLPGEIITVGNTQSGFVSKFVPYDEAGQAYHLPKIIFEHLKEKTYDVFVEQSKNGMPTAPSIRTTKEFSIEELPPLTQEELETLKIKQLAENRLSD